MCFHFSYETVPFSLVDREWASMKGVPYWAVYSPATENVWDINMDCAELAMAMSAALDEGDRGYANVLEPVLR